MSHKHVGRAIKQMFQSTPRYRQVLPNPLNDDSPWFFTAGPVFMPGADGAILNSKLSKPWQTWNGYGYRIANPQYYTPNQETPQLYAPKGVPTVGINIQLPSNEVYTPSVNGDGTFANQGIFAYDSGAAQYGNEYSENGMDISYS
jgi:hypothetical protein